MSIKSSLEITDEHRREFLCAFAEAILTWQLVENTLFVLLMAIFRSERPEILSAAYHAVTSFDAKR